MRILWCVSGLASPLDSAMEFTASSMASHRYRVGYPSLYLERLGHENGFLTLSDALPARGLPETDCAVFSKITAPGPQYFAGVRDATIRAARQLQAAGIPIIVDVCDFHFFPGEPRGETVRELMAVADVVTCNSREMATMVKEAVPDCPRVVVVPDPVEQQRKAPSSPPDLSAVKKLSRARALLGRLAGRAQDAVVRLLWFGHPSNMEYLLRHLKPISLLAQRVRCRLTLCTGDHPQLASRLAAARKEAGDVLDIRFLEWSMQTIGQALLDADMVVIPGDPSDPVKRAAGNNRLIEAIWAGRFVVANALPSYREFSDLAWIGSDLQEGITWALNFPEEARKRIEGGQRKIEQEYTQDRIGQRWLTVLSEAIARH